MGILLTLEHGEQRAVVDVGSTDADILLWFSQKEVTDARGEAGHQLTLAEIEDLRGRLKFSKLAGRVLPRWYKNGRTSSAGELRAAAEELLDWCNRQREVLPYVYLANQRPMPELDYNGFSKGRVSDIHIAGEIFRLETGLGLCELQRVVEEGGWNKVVERRDLRGEVAKGLDRIVTDVWRGSLDKIWPPLTATERERITTGNRMDVLLKRRKVALKLPSILKSVAEFAARFPPEDTIMVSCRHPPGKKRRDEEEEEGDL